MKKIIKPKNNFTKDLIILIIIGLLCYFGYNEIRFSRIQKSIVTTTESLKELDNIDNIVTRLLKEIMNKLIDQNKIVEEVEKNIDNKIDNKIQQKTFEVFLLERKLQITNVVIVNATVGAQGSGVTLKYKGKYYILSAGHMLDNPEDNLVLIENEQKICDLEVVKYAFTGSNIFGEDQTKGFDLLLLRPKNKDIIPRFYVELADYELPTGSEIYIVGNPLGIEDVISDGRIIKYENNYLLFIDHSYFGNSGGGIYTKDGKLLGINSFIGSENRNPSFPPYVIGGAVRLSAIKYFLGDIE